MTAWIYAESQLWSRIAAWFAGIKSEFVLNFITKNRWRMLLNGLGTTLLITLFSCLMGIAIGVVVSIVRSTWDKAGADMRPGFSRGLLRVLNRIAVIYLTVIRGTPVVIQLMIAYYVIFAFSSNGVLVATLAFGLNSGAYVAEIFRGGIMSIDYGQMEAARSLGLNYTQATWRVILPQTIKNVFPSLGNELIVLLKETSISGYIALQDLTKAGDIVRSRTYLPFFPYISVAAIYLVLVLILEKILGNIEGRMAASDR